MTKATGSTDKNRKSSNNLKTLKYVPPTPALITILGRRLSHTAGLQFKQSFGVNIVDWGIFKVLTQLSDLSARQIGEILFFDKALISRRLKVLNTRGYVKTRIDNKNKAQTKSSLTARGRKLYNDMAKTTVDREIKHFRGFTQTEKKTLSKLLFRILENTK